MALGLANHRRKKKSPPAAVVCAGCEDTRSATGLGNLEAVKITGKRKLITGIWQILTYRRGIGCFFTSNLQYPALVSVFDSVAASLRGPGLLGFPLAPMVRRSGVSIFASRPFHSSIPVSYPLHSSLRRSYKRTVFWEAVSFS